MPNFRRYVSEQALSLIGTWVETAAQALLVLRLTHSGTVAAVLAGTVGIGWCFVVNAVSFGFVIVSLLSLDTRRLYPVPPVPRGRGQLRAGLRYAASVPAIIRPLLMMALVGTSRSSSRSACRCWPRPRSTAPAPPTAG